MKTTTNIKEVREAFNSLSAEYRDLRKEIRSNEKEVEKLTSSNKSMRQRVWIIQAAKRDLKVKLDFHRDKKVRFPRIKTPRKIMKILRKPSDSPISTSDKYFYSFVYFDGVQWVTRVYGVEVAPDKSTEPVSVTVWNKRKHYFYNQKVVGVEELYREYEDGRCFKSWRIRPKMFGITFDMTPYGSFWSDGKPEVMRKKWVCRYGYQNIMDDQLDPAVPRWFMNKIAKEFDALDMIRTYKKYPLCRHLLSIGESSMAFNKTILRRLKGEKLMKFKNWWQQSTDSGWFYHKPRLYEDIKRVCLDEWKTQRQIFTESMLKADPNMDRRLINYMFRQRESSLRYYKDYVDALVEHNYPLIPQLLYPKNLRQAHDMMMKKKTAKELELKRIERSKKTMPTIYPEMTVPEKGVRIVPFNDASMFTTYGQYMSHCYKDIDSYFEEAVRGETVLFAIVNAITGEPLSVATYSVTKKTIVQNRSTRNGDVPEELKLIASEYGTSLISQSCLLN